MRIYAQVLNVYFCTEMFSETCNNRLFIQVAMFFISADTSSVISTAFNCKLNETTNCSKDINVMLRMKNICVSSAVHMHNV